MSSRSIVSSAATCAGLQLGGCILSFRICSWRGLRVKHVLLNMCCMVLDGQTKKYCRAPCRSGSHRAALQVLERRMRGLIASP